MPTYAHFQQFNPARPLDWRWERAQVLASPGRRCSPKRDDSATRLAVEFLRQQRGRHCGRNSDLLTGFTLADVAAAYGLYQGGRERTTELEARILAGQSAEEIATRIGITSSAVIAYEAVFYAVRDRLEAATYVLLGAVGADRLIPGSGRCDRSSLIRLLGIFGGPVVLDAVVAAVANSTATMTPSDVPSSLSAKIESLTAVLQQPLSPGAALKLAILCRCFEKSASIRPPIALNDTIPGMETLVSRTAMPKTGPDVTNPGVERSEHATRACMTAVVAA